MYLIFEHVGIGTTSPTQQLQITQNALLPTAVSNTSGNLFFVGDTTSGTNGVRLFSLDANGGGFIDVKASTAANGILFRADITNGGTERMRITAGGNVGIGTTSPGVLLHAESSSTASTDFRLKNSSTNGRSWVMSSLGQSNGLGAGKFNIFDEGAGASRLTIDTAGNVGIATTSPAATLDVVGNARRSGGLGDII